GPSRLPVLAGRVVVVSGAGQGVGAGIAASAAAAGAQVVVTARKAAAATAVAQGITERGHRAVAIRCDVTSRTDVDATIAETVERFGALHGLVHNATSGYSSRPVPFQDVPEENWDDQVAVGLRAAYYLAQAGLPHLRAVDGSYVILTSTAGMEGSTPIPTYSTIKASQRTLVRSLAREWGPLGVRVNALAPVAVTPAMADFLTREPEAASRLAARAALQRLGDAEFDIGPTVNFLLGPDSRFVTGQTLVVNGGSFMF
ncbi:MAG TPA: SDR family oxidoreductase, partial [Acidimicrobiales bacterium]|nr:SDR family oxidoreductase [Acidimicrobiales bacterium]